MIHNKHSDRSDYQAETRIVAYTPPYVKENLNAYVNLHPDMTMSKFITDAVRDKLRSVGALSGKK